VIRSLLFVALLRASFGAAVLSAQGAETPGTMVRARDQARSIVRELLTPPVVDTLGRASVTVEGRGTRVLVENAVYDYLRERGVTSVLNAREGSSTHLIRLLVLEQRADFSPLGSGGVLRTVRTTIEGRMERANGVVLALGRGTRMSVDTVASMEADPFGSDPDEPGILDTLLTPVIVVGSAAIVVILLFTVRS
jgi:hypothetical protein